MHALFSRLLNIQLDIYSKLPRRNAFIDKVKKTFKYIWILQTAYCIVDTYKAWRIWKYYYIKERLIKIHAKCKIINGWDTSITILNNYSSSSFMQDLVGIIKIIYRYSRKKGNTKGDWIKSNKLNKNLNDNMDNIQIKIIKNSVKDIKVMKINVL